ncbi:MAG TPA: ATP-binding protein [Pyrinomonadaceae bacterium]|jgi:PAS domain S-box-containing protein
MTLEAKSANELPQEASIPKSAGKNEDYYRRQLKAIADNATLGMFIMDERQHCVFMNPAAEQLTGYSFAELEGQPLHNYIHHTRPDGRPYPLEECPIDRVFPQNNHEQGEEIFVHKNGTFYPVSFTASPIREGGKIVGTIIEVRDITREKEAERERERAAQEKEKLLIAEKESREESETLRRIGQIISAELNLQKIVQAVTDAATELTGAQFGAFFYNVLDEEGASYMLYTLSGVAPEKFSNFPMPRATDMFGPTFRGEGTVRIADVHEDSRFGKNEPYHGMPKGHLPVTSYLAVSVTSRSGEVLGGLFFGHEKRGVFSEGDERIVEGLAAQAAVAMDNARLFEEAQRERAKAERIAQDNARLLEEAQEANRLKDEFLATVSHELRTPLTSITGWVRMLRSGMLDEPQMNRALETIDRNTRAQTQIIEDLLDISRIISGKLRLDIRIVELSGIIEAAIESASPAAEAKNIRLHMLLDQKASPVAGDADRLQQVVWNLVSNSVKFTPKGGRIQVRLERINSHVEISVSDTGQGIEPEFLPHVFERFRQGDSSIARRFGGLGLGLAIVRQLVEMHGGTVAASSPGENQGATFTVLLPLAIVHNQSFEETKEIFHSPDIRSKISFNCPPQLDGLRILVVDDETDAREMLTFVLNQCQAQVQSAASAAEALAMIEDFNPHILVSDVGMPEEDGYDLIRQVRAREKAANQKPIPAIALTAYTRIEDRMQALSAGFQTHVPKPVEPAELAAVIASLSQWETR